MRSRWHSGLVGVLAAALSGCPAVNSPPCQTDGDCPGGACRRGACGPQCLSQLDCAPGETCADGTCAPAPECAAASDCASGFTCAEGICKCLSDAACAVDQACIDGACRDRPACQGDADCAPYGRRCELTQGLCVPPCGIASDCAPGMDPTLAGLLYQCRDGNCLRRCVNDASCGAGLLCRDGACTPPGCHTRSDCPAGEYCTSADAGECLPYLPCTSSAECPPNQGCSPFQGACPPGIDCAQPVCQELPRCLVDANCAPPAYCQDRHCQPAALCGAGTGCGGGFGCVGGACVPAGCRGQADCVPPEACTGGICRPPPSPSQVIALSLAPDRAVLEVGDSIRLHLIAFAADGSSFPLAAADFAALDAAGNPSAAIAASPGGVVTASAAGSARIVARLAGSAAPPAEALVEAYAPPAPAQRRVVVIDAATGAPLGGVFVRACDSPPPDGPCPAPIDLVTDARGQVELDSPGAASDITVASAELRPGDGLPAYDRVSFAGTSARDLLVALEPSPVHAAGGFTGALTFDQVHGTGPYWLGVAALAVPSLAELDQRSLLGDPFFVTLPGVGFRAQLPGAVELLVDPGTGMPLPIKGRAYGVGAPGRRIAAGFAGRIDPQDTPGFATAQLLSYVEALDFALSPPVDVPLLPLAADAADLDGDGRCSDPVQCPLGPEELPDYARLPAIGLQPSRQQLARTEVVLPALPAGLDSAIVAAAQAGPFGVVPLGLASEAGGPIQPDGTRPLLPIIVHGGAPYSGAEAGTGAVWALATSAATRSQSARMLAADPLPLRAVLPPLLPPPAGAAYDPATRLFAPGQPAWSAAASSGAALARIALTGPDSRHVVYFALSGAQTSVRIPESPPGAGTDAAAAAQPSLEASALALPPGVPADDALDLPGLNLSRPERLVEGASRWYR